MKRCSERVTPSEPPARNPVESEDDNVEIARFLKDFEHVVAAGMKIPIPDGAEGVFSPRLWKAMILGEMAQKLFRQVQSELGSVDAMKMFHFFAGLTKREVEEIKNRLLLMAYYASKLPVQQFARKFACHNSSTRNVNGNVDAITKQLNRLLKQDPAKQRTPFGRLVLSAAQTVRWDTGGERGRPRLKK